MPTDTLVANALTIVVEILSLLLIVIVLNAVTRTLLRVVARMEAFRKLRRGLEVVGVNLRLLWMGLAVLGSLALAGWNGWLWYQGTFLPNHMMDLVASIPDDFWIELGLSSGWMAAVAIALVIVLRTVGKLLGWACERAKAAEGVKANDEAVETFFAGLRRLAKRSSWLWFVAASAQKLSLADGLVAVAYAALFIYLIVAAGLLIRSALDAVVASLDALSRKYRSENNLLRHYDHVQHLLPLLRRALEYVIYVSVASLVALQVQPFAALADWWPRLVRVIGIVFLARLAIEILNLLIDEFLVKRAKVSAAEKQRRLTLVPLVQSFFKYAIYFSAAVMVLAELGIDPTPVLAGAGILGLAVGMGARSLISDFIHGFFILFEDYFLVGDVIRIGDAEGLVESVDLLTTRVRDEAGRLHILRNGTIANVINFSKQYVHAVVDLSVAYESDLAAVHAAVAAAGERAAEEYADVLSATHVQGVSDFGESGLHVRTVTRVKPGKHRQVARDVRRLLLHAFAEHDVEIPYARRVLIWKGAEPALSGAV